VVALARVRRMLTPVRDDTLSVVRVGADGSVALSNGSSLIAREIEVLRLIAQGKSNREAAQSLFLSINTVEYYATRIYEKLGARNRTEAATLAIGLGILRIDSVSASAGDKTMEVQAASPARTALLSSGDHLLGRAAMQAFRVIVRRAAIAAVGVALFLAGLLALRIPDSVRDVLSAGAPERHCVAEAIAFEPGRPRPTADPPSRPKAVCFDTPQEVAAYLGFDPYLPEDQLQRLRQQQQQLTPPAR